VEAKGRNPVLYLRQAGNAAGRAGHAAQDENHHGGKLGRHCRADLLKTHRWQQAAQMPLKPALHCTSVCGRFNQLRSGLQECAKELKIENPDSQRQSKQELGSPTSRHCTNTLKTLFIYFLL